MTRPFDTVLVANRGEIACRVIGTLDALGIRSVAVFSDADRDAKHVALADAAVRIGPADARSSYLDIDAIIAVARATGAEAIHPGYGFLSENAAFASACEAAGIVFIGPGVRALGVMGDKIRAKQQVELRGVPTTPGIARPGLTDDDLVAAAPEIGFPVLIKPSAGGGGKGMQVVERPDELPAALAAARRVAASAFGDDTLFLERFVPQPRHIEVQLLADRHGSVVHLGERECSLQRRHQKVIEEAPSPLLDVETRERIGEAACEVARSVDYEGAGTVEFLVSAAAPDEFFFMEMNTRLQVEHPVTEAVTGLDLIEWQLRIAAGEPLTFRQDQVAITGHAIEARVYAESPERGFLPASGTVLTLEQPTGEGIRVDSSLIPGLRIPPDYDPMLAKVVAHAPDRATAIARLDEALAATTILGVPTNVEYLRALLAEPEVRSGDLDTGLIDRRIDDLVFRVADDHVLAAAALAVHERRSVTSASVSVSGTGSASSGSSESGPWGSRSGWRLGDPRPPRISFAAGSLGDVEVAVSGTADDATITITREAAAGSAPTGAPEERSGREPGSRPETPPAADAPSDAATPSPSPSTTHSASLVDLGDGRVGVTVDDIRRTLRLAVAPASPDDHVWVGEDGFAIDLLVRGRETRLADSLARLQRAAGTVDPVVRSPMPGTVVAVAVADGDEVAEGQTVVTVEAMKMEHRLTAPIAGVVQIGVRAGDLVRLDQTLATIYPPDGGHDPGPPEQPTRSAEAGATP